VAVPPPGVTMNCRVVSRADLDHEGRRVCRMPPVRPAGSRASQAAVNLGA
jgi:hypothetical protein